MKKILLVIVALMLCFNVKAQTTLTEASDFYSTDEFGRDYHLFDILDNGQYALLYFFFTDAETSSQFDPCIAEAYYHYGANQDDVYFIGIDPTGDSLRADGWRIEYQLLDFPVLHRMTEGYSAVDICDNYGVNIFSTLVLIAPNREILIDNIWPITSTQQLIDEIDAYIEVDAIDEFENKGYGIYPNPASSEIKINSNGKAEVNIYDMTGRCVKNVFVNDVNNASIDISDINEGIYFIDVNGKVEKLIVQ